MNAVDALQLIMKDRGRTQKSVAEAIYLSPTTFGKKLSNGTLTAQEFYDAIHELGLTITISEKETGGEWKERKRGVMPPVSMVVDHVRYDTSKADAVCFVETKSGWVMELYRDSLGRNFLAVGSIHNGTRTTIIPCTETEATLFKKEHLDTNG
jgi:transcriptional regulator with XRE-family HTH domain